MNSYDRRPGKWGEVWKRGDKTLSLTHKVRGNSFVRLQQEVIYSTQNVSECGQYIGKFQEN